MEKKQRHFDQFASVSSTVKLGLCHSEETMSHGGQTPCDHRLFSHPVIWRSLHCCWTRHTRHRSSIAHTYWKCCNNNFLDRNMFFRLCLRATEV